KPTRIMVAFRRAGNQQQAFSSKRRHLCCVHRRSPGGQPPAVTAGVFKELKRYVEAIASYDKGIALRPANAEAHCNRGAALLDLKRLDRRLQASTSHRPQTRLCRIPTAVAPLRNSGGRKRRWQASRKRSPSDQTLRKPCIIEATLLCI